MKNRLFRFLLVILLQLGLVLGICTSTSPALALTSEQTLLNQVWRIVSRSYLDDSFNNQDWWAVRQKALKQPLPDRQATYDAIRALLASLEDPFTRLLEPSDYKNLQVSTSGELTGIGVQITTDRETGEVVVIAALAGSPAEKAGLLPGDRILTIDDVATQDLSIDQAAALMRGVPGSLVHLTVSRKEEEPQVYELVREVIALKSVIAELRQEPEIPPLGYVRLLQFNGNSSAEVAQAIQDLAVQGAEAYLLDLRNNPGGLLQAGIEVAREWLDYGVIVYTVDRKGTLGIYRATNPALTEAPLVVLVNRGTASASEILAGALQENDRAVLVGEKTFGKGLIQSLFELPDGSGLVITVAKYETPLHHDIHKLGIQPDYVVPFTVRRADQWATEADLQYQKALELLRAGST